MGTGEGGRRRRKVDGDDSDGDEEYVAEEEDEEEEEEYREELSASSAGEEGGGSDAEYDVDEEDEDCETPRPKQPVKGGDRGRKRKRNPAAVRSRQRRYDEDDDYLEELEEDEEIDDYQEDLEDEEETPRPKCSTKCAGRSQKAKQHGRSRWRHEEEEEEDLDFEPELDEGEEDEIGDYQEDLEEEEEPPRLKCAAKSAGRSQKAKLHPVSKRSNRWRHEKEEDIDFEPEEGEEEEDMDFDPEVEDDEDEFEDDEEEELGISHTRKVRVKNTVRRKPASKQRGGKKKKSYSKVSRRKVNSTKARKAAPVRRRRKRSVIDHYEDDEDFIVDDQVEVNRQSRKKARLGRRIEVDHPVPDVEADAWPTVDSDTSDFNFVTSDEEHEDIEQVLAEQVRVTVRKGRRKRILDSGSSSDSEFHVSENETGDFRETEPLETERKKRTVVSQSSSDSEFHALNKEVGISRETERKKRIFVSESSPDSEFHVSDKDLGDVRETGPLEAVKKRIFVPGSSSDSEFHVSNEKLGDFRETGPLEAGPMLPASLRRISFKRNGEDKGKEKTEQVDTGKPRCGICLSEDQRMTLQGVLNCCSHYFCFACIMEWSKVESRCPLCKRRFTTITKSSKMDLGMGLKKSVIRVEERDQVYQPTEEEIRRWLDPYENLVCIECNEGGDDSLMLLCDICDSSAHTYCVGLGREVPEGNWYCGGCRLSGEGPSHPRSSVNSNSSELGTTAPIGTFERSPSINPRQNFQGFDLNVSPREIPGENHPAQSQASTTGVRLGTLSRRRGWIRTLLDRRPVISPDMGLNGVQHSGTEPNHRNFFAPSEANTSQHRGSVRRTEPNHRNFEGTSENNSSQTMSRYLRMLVHGPRPAIGLDMGHNGVQHSGSVSRTEPNRRHFCPPSEGNTSQTLLDDIRNQHNFFPLVQAQRNSTPCISVDGNNFQQNEGVKSNGKHMYSISPH